MKKNSSKGNKSKSKKQNKNFFVIGLIIILLILSVAGYFGYDYFIRIKDYSLTVDVGGVSEALTVQTKMGKFISLTAPEKEGYTFKGWFLDSAYTTPFDPLKDKLTNGTLYAKMEVTMYSVNFNSNGGSLVETLEFVYNSIPKEPIAPDKADYMFCGWYSDEALTIKYDFNNVVNDNLNLYADWILISDALTYANDYGHTYITGYKDKISPYLYIPEYIEGAKVYMINPNAFKDCTKLKQVYIYNKDMYINLGIFNGCTSIEKMTLSFENNSSLRSLFNTDVPENVKTVNVVEGLYNLRDGTFAQCKFVETINLPESLTSIGISAFNGCESLKNIKIPLNVTTIEIAAFINCYKLEKIEIPKGVEVLKNTTFSQCSGLREVILPEGFKRIEDFCFSGCIILEKINLPDTIDIIGNYAFERCFKLDNVILPSSLTEIKDATFAMCKSLTKITLPQNLKIIGLSAFSSCSALETINFPEGLTTIGNSAFGDCKALNNLVIPSSVTILDCSFYNCTNLNNIILNEGLIELKPAAFYECSALKTIIIPSTVTTVGDQAFCNCINLESITFKGSTPPSITPEMITYKNQYLKIYVPSNAVNTYKNKINWTNYSSYINPIE